MLRVWLIGFLALPLLGRQAHATPPEPVKTAQAQVARLEAERARQAAELVRARAEFQQKNSVIADRKRQRLSWYQSRTLEKLLVESQRLADGLDAQDKRLQATATELRAARIALIEVIDGALAGPIDRAEGAHARGPAPPGRDASPTMSTEQRAALEQLRTAQRYQLEGPARKITIAEVRIDPLDDPEDLEEKAALLWRSEQKLVRESTRLSRRATYYARQAQLQKSQRRNDALDLFSEEQSVRHTGSAGTAIADAPADELSPGTDNDPGRTDEAVDITPPAAVYSDVIDPSTLSDFQKAERSGDPGQLAEAAIRAARDVKARASRLARLRQSMEDRAKLLRRPGK